MNIMNVLYPPKKGKIKNPPKKRTNDTDKNNRDRRKGIKRVGLPRKQIGSK